MTGDPSPLALEILPMIIPIYLLGCASSPPTPDSPADAAQRQNKNNDDDTGTDCAGHLLQIAPLVDTSGVSAPYMPVTTHMREGRICAASCNESWIDVWVAASPSCGAALAYPVTVRRLSGGVALCFALTGEPPVEPWAADCTVEHSDNTTTALTVSW